MNWIRDYLAALATAGVFLFVPPVSSSMVTDQVVFILDSSGSVYDPLYENWQSEIDFARSVYESTRRADGSVAYGLVNFSGCSASHNLASCLWNQERLKVEWGLDDPQSPTDLDAAFAALGPDDFNGGYTWTDEALLLALALFGTGSTPEILSRTVVMLTDGAPSQGHEPWTVDNGVVTYSSATTQALLALDVTLNLVAVDVSQATIDGFLSADFANAVAVDGFDALDFQSLRGSLVLPGPATLAAGSIAVPGPPPLALLVLGMIGLLATSRAGRRAEPAARTSPEKPHGSG